jgi:hypothetical protein
MRKFLFALVAVLACGSFVSASEPALEGLGLDGLQTISETEGMEVRGLAAVSNASGLSSLGAIFYDTTSGSKANLDLVNFSAGGEDDAAPGGTADAQNFNSIGLTTGIDITFPGAAAGVSAFGGGGASQNVVNANPAVFTVPAPATFVP